MSKHRRKIVMDANVAIRLFNNVDYTVKDIRAIKKGGHALWIAEAAWQEVVNQAPSRQLSAERAQLLRDLKIRIAPTRNRPGMDKANEDNRSRDWGLKPKDGEVVAHAKAEGAEVWTYDKSMIRKIDKQSDNSPVTADERRKAGRRGQQPRERKSRDDLVRRHGQARLAKESKRSEANGSFTGGKPSEELKKIRKVRKSFDLRLKVATGGGTVVDPKKSRNAVKDSVRPKKKSTRPATSEPTNGASSEPRTRASIGKPNRPKTQSGGPSATGTAKVNAVDLLLQGVHFSLDLIIDYIVAERVEEAWEKVRPGVETDLNDNRQFGALVVLRYFKRDGSVNIQVEYGYTRSDAMRKFVDKPQLRRADARQFWWIPPKAPVDWTKLRTPFEKFALARFEPGNEALVRVKFTGDDEYPFDESSLADFVEFDNPQKIEVRVLVLKAPIEFTWRDPDEGEVRGSVPLVQRTAGSGEKLLAVDLDAGFLDVGDAAAIPVFPANDAAEAMFKGRHTENLTANLMYRYSNIEMMAWAWPGDIEIIELIKKP